MVEKLKPCPFCGGEVYPVYSSITKKYYMYHYGRNKNPCCIEQCEFSGLLRLKCLKDAYTAWNNRAEMEVITKEQAIKAVETAYWNEDLQEAMRIINGEEDKT